MEPELAQRRCVPCEKGTPPLEPGQLTPLLAQVPGWQLDQAKGHDQLVRTFRFPDFRQAVEFVNRIAEVAEAEGHHPDLSIGWGRVQVRLWTHAAGGLTLNDFILAAKIDRLAAG